MTYDTRTMANSNGVGGEDLTTVEFQTVKTPLPTDILCGKNKICIKHEGSKSFRRIIESYTQKYQDAGSRNEKMEVTKEIFDRLQSRRFLKYNEDTDMWETLHPLAVRDKIGHALRFSNRKGNTTIRKQVVRHSASDMAALGQPSGSVTDMASLRRNSMSMNCMESAGSMGNLRRRHSKQALNKLRHSTGTRPNRIPSVSSNQDILTALPSFRSLAIGSSMHKDAHDIAQGNQNAVFPSRTTTANNRPNMFQTAGQDILTGLPSFSQLEIGGVVGGNQNANSVFPIRTPSTRMAPGKDNSSSIGDSISGSISGSINSTNSMNVFQSAGQDMINLSTLQSLAIANNIELKTIHPNARLSNNCSNNTTSGEAVLPQSAPSSVAAAPSSAISSSNDGLDDLSWMLQMPLMDMDGEGQVYFVNEQQQLQQQLQQFSV